MDKVFEEIKKAFLDSFDKCEVINQTTVIKVGFEDKADAEWFKRNIAYPEGVLEDEVPIHVVVSSAPLEGTDPVLAYDYIFKFKINDKEKLLDLLRKRE